MISNSNTMTSAIEFKNITKKFGNIIANNDVSFSVKAGTIHALVGENGAGKSTTAKILFGLYKEDSGEILVNGKAQHWRSPKDAIKNRIGMVHQHFMLAETETCLDNIILGNEEHTLKFPFLPIPFNIVNRKKAKNEIKSIIDKYGLDIPLDTKISQLSVDAQQRVEIIKVLYRNADILILDEPTAVLTPQKVDEFFVKLKMLKNEGKTIIIITHKLREVLNFTDNITVFKAGRVVGELKTSEATEEKIATLMIGKNVNLKPEIPTAQKSNKAVLKLQNIHLKNYKFKKNRPPCTAQNTSLDEKALHDITLQINEGEIVGIAGIEGNGQSELTEFVHKYTLQNPQLVTGFIPEDRHKDGLLLNFDMEDNYLLGRQWEKQFRIAHLFKKSKELTKVVKNEINKFDIRPNNLKLNISRFSGGNQQKVIIARELSKNPKFIIAANPTRGVDIGAIEFIHKQIVAERNNGKGVLLISSELDEIMQLSDRILVIYNGEIVSEFARGEASEYILGLAMCGAFSQKGTIK